MYWIVKEKFEDEDNGSYESYGMGTAGYYIADISTNLQNVENLTLLCNAYGLSRIHIQDVVEDWLEG
ncbi:DUF6514 family protein [Hydrogenoanaerobacterium sp.]|uniref:DUF6514 family protein n=1 Tax=Hydrogenoanaerobacterium sp. TaxID=2953763 RepID=UPI002897D9F9|nr:hypothetical protein [Hydrogenoanaerobacterium sp.]